VCRVVLCVFRTVKYYFKAEVEFERQVTDTDELQHTTAQFYIRSMITASDPLDIHSVISFFQNSIEAFTSRGSGWNVNQILNLSLYMGVFRPAAGSSFIKTPPEIANKKAILNIHNSDSNCFQYSILAALHPPNNIDSNHVRYYTKYLSELDMTGIETPISLSSSRNSSHRTLSFPSMFWYTKRTTLFPYTFQSF